MSAQAEKVRPATVAELLETDEAKGLLEAARQTGSLNTTEIALALDELELDAAQVDDFYHALDELQIEVVGGDEEEPELDDEAQVRLDHLLLGAVVAALDPLRELDLLRSRQQIDLADVLEEELQRVRRDLTDLGGRWQLLVFDDADDLDVKLLERLVEVVDLGRIQLELVESQRDVRRAE